MKQVCIVEDDKQLQDLYREVLTEAGYEVYIFSTGKEALDGVLNINPVVIIMDLMLPGSMNGVDVIKAFRQMPTLKKVPIVLLTCLDNQENTAANLAIAHYFVKTDITPGDLVRIVDEVSGNNKDLN